MYTSFALVAILFFYEAHSASSVSSHFGIPEREKFKNVFADAMLSTDVAQMYYAIEGYRLLNEVPASTKESCKVLDNFSTKAKSPEELFYLISTSKYLTCSHISTTSAVKSLQDIFSSDTATVTELYYAVLGLKNSGQTLSEANKSKLAKLLQGLLKREDTLLSLAHAFHIAAELGINGQFVSDRIEDALAQADEVDGKMLQFEGGLSLTSLILTGIIRLSNSLGKPAYITADQSVKFSTYLLSRRSVQTAKGCTLLLNALTLISNDKAISPTVISLVGSPQISSENPQVNLRVCNLLGQPLDIPSDSVIAQSGTRQGQVVLSKQKLTPVQGDKTLYKLDLMKIKPEKGVYKLVLSAGSHTGNIVVKVLGRISVKSLEVSIGDADQAAPAKKQTVPYPKKMTTVLEADSLQRVLLKVLLADESDGKPMTVHQCFVKLSNSNNKQEIIFVAEQDSTQTYKFEMDVGSKSIDFNHKSGLYHMELIVGDALLSNSFKWHIADINLKFSQEAISAEHSASRLPKPEIVHKFREPDRRPSRLVSDLFTGLCLTPLVILFVLWVKLKINVSNFPLSLSALGFHSGFGAILGLFVIFWLKLNMFETLRYLSVLSLVTFICGHRLLRTIAQQRK
ncbi:dolichyl-diphosphooligosaccharide--protein glycosyltransferase subunit 2 [Ctenocephalides felis]|uniref:dolichyl-diphosphooligosaccharide--protein glycosyltransferase subunit 2 n=1 Tax=Ctenocephalides felis TaxID=7515 RepID=UPI000E6E52D5|nr:dolichyl-diphosphooligosaccharide--protein glycosyltransferase subunit 2 [Ctenocephalides felis]